MIDEPTQDAAALYALDLLDPEGARAFEARLSGDAELNRLVEELRESGAALADTLAPVAPPSALRQHVLMSVQSPPRRHGRRRRRKRWWVPWALAACFAIACTYFLVEARRLHSRLGDVASEREVLRRKYDEALADEARAAADNLRLERERAQLAAEKQETATKLAEVLQRDAFAQVRIASLTAQLNAYARAVAVVVWDPQKQRGIARFDRLPQPEADKVYQLWVIDPTQPVPVSGGVFSVAPSGSAQMAFAPARPVGSAGKFAVTVEAAGGAATPTVPIIMVGE